VLLLWLALSLLAGPSAPVALCREALASSDTAFHGLPTGPALSVLHERFGYGVTASDGRKLYDLIASRGYRRALEVGTARGYSAIWLGLAMRATGGTVVTLEIDPATAATARENIRRAGLDFLVTVRVNDALREIPELEGEFDLVFLDLGGPHQQQLVDLAAKRLSRGGAIVSHNAWFVRFTPPPDFDTVVLPTLSGGIAVSTRRP
jgi:predicted O-methyltransferase YrrM